MQITAAIVTYNRLNLLKNLITALQNQTYKISRIVVINNSSTDGTKEYLETLSNVEVVTQPNWGSSGGQFTSAKYCYETGSEWIWIMDDDILPKADTLENLIKNIDKKRIHVPMRINHDNSINTGDTLKLNFSNPFQSIWKKINDSNYPNTNEKSAEGVSFEGPLFHRDLITDIGLPEFGFFIYADDTEFFVRALKKGYKSYIITNAVLNRLLPIADENIFNWKTYYLIRNPIAIDALHAPFFVRIIRPWGYLISWLLKMKFKAVKTVFQAFFHGYFYKKHPKNIEFEKK